MNKFMVLCATMHQENFDKIKEMNIKSDVFFANQADRFAFEEYNFERHTARMLTTPTRGVGVNRNLALLFTDAQIALLADDDVRYRNGYAEEIVKIFAALPQADVIIFGLEYIHDGTREPPKISKIQKMGRFSRNPFGGPSIAFRVDAVRKANIGFSTVFGGGSWYLSGEDSMFIEDCRDKGLNVYTHPYIIGQTDITVSRWFQGYGEKYFFDMGAFIQARHPYTWPLWMRYVVFRAGKNLSISKKAAKKWTENGAAGFRKSMTYPQWKEAYQQE